MRKPTEFVNHPMKLVSPTFRAVVKHVVDGDTLDVMIDLGLYKYAYETIRLRGIDCPEIYRPTSPQELAHGRAARERLIQLVLDQPVMLVTYKDAQSFGRFEADVKLLKETDIDVVSILKAEGFEKKSDYSVQG